MKEKYHTSSHSKSLIKFHFGIVVKYRKPLLFGEMNDDMLLIVQEIGAQYGSIIDEMQSDVNHLHFLLDIPPQFSALEIIHKIKQISTFRIYKKHRSFLKKHFWKENTFWKDGSFVCSTGDASTETIQKYIAEQG
jgi:putative transposase